ncbi:elongation factor TS-domain-containing protein [Obelidium mucronatum]|nr:elongation factor TS-domain-containing protein [Obelidium mucronatum]
MSTFLRRFLSTATAPKPSVAQLVARLRKETSAPIAKAKAALEESNFDFEKALVSLKKSAQKTSEKVANRTTKEGFVALFNAGMVEVNCESDFVQRADLFRAAVKDVAGACEGSLSADATGSSSSLFRDVDADVLAKWVDSAIVPGTSITVKERTVEAIAKLGENIRIRKAITAVTSEKSNNVVFGGYTHGGSDFQMGKIAALVALRVAPYPVSASSKPALDKLVKQLAQQVVGFSPSVVRDSDIVSTLAKSKDELESLVLERQQFLAGGGTVKEVLNTFKQNHALTDLEIVEFRRLEVGEGIEVVESNFAEEVAKQAGLKA